MRRTTLVIVVILAVVIVAAGGTAYFVLTRLDGIVQAAIEEFGSRATGTAVSLDGVEIDTTSGRGVLRGLRVANPEGFTAVDALSIGETSIAIDLSSLTGDTVVIRDVAVRSPRFRYEVGPEGVNFDRIYANVQRSGGQGQDAAGTEDKGGSGDAAQAGGAGRRIVVQRLLIEGAEVSVAAAQLGSKGMEFALPTLELRDLGTDDQGLTSAELLGRIMASLQKSADAEIAKIPQLRALVASPLTESIKEALESTGDKLDSLGESLEKLLKD